MAMAIAMPLLMLTLSSIQVRAFASTSLSSMPYPFSNDEAADWTMTSAEFPEDFVWGTATSAYQVEGAVNEGGRGPSIWDEIVQMPGEILNHDNADVAVDQYHHYKEDIDLMVDVGMTHYRFSISWPRIIPDGEGEVNPQGIAYYDRLIDALLAKGITPVVTLFHWDLPLALHRKYGGWLNESLVPLFARYADACFQAFGDRVKQWITFNEPRIEYQREFLTGCFQSCRPEPDCALVPTGLPCDCNECYKWMDGVFKWVPYRTTHTIILSHVATAKIYNSKYKPIQGGKIGITLDCEWAEPYTSSEADRAASERYHLFNLGWFLYPLLKGDYPPIMREFVGDRLPHFTDEQKAAFSGSLDFLGLNQYTSRYAKDAPQPTANNATFYADMCCLFIAEGPDGKLIGPMAGSDWLYVYPAGMKKLLLWVHREFPGFPIYITENGFSDKEHAQPPDSYFNDIRRVGYYASYLRNMAEAMWLGVNVKGYFAWSTVDNFEWKMGYSERFGIYYVDFANNLTRIAKKSAFWWKFFLKNSRLNEAVEPMGTSQSDF